MSDPSIGYVLICHAPRDKAYSAGLARQLRAARIRAYWDEDEAAADVLARRVRKSAALLVVMTAAAEEYELVTDQVKQARREQTPVYALSVDGETLFELDDAPSWPSARGEKLDDGLVQNLARDVELRPLPSRRNVGIGTLTAAVAGCVVVAVVTTLLVADIGDSGASPTTTIPAVTGPAASALATGALRIDSPLDGALVNRCQKINGAADLAGDLTMMYAVNRVDPPSNDWYYGYVGAYQNGSVPPSWTGAVYFGSTTKQKYDLFIYVMGVDAAKAFWNKHQSKDGSYAYGKGAPQGKAAAHIRVTQGSTNDC